MEGGEKDPAEDASDSDDEPAARHDGGLDDRSHPGGTHERGFDFHG